MLMQGKPSSGAQGRLRIGYVPLTDAAPLIVARERGFFEKHGVAVQLCRELGWGTIRDSLIYGELDAVHAPAGLLFSLLAGTRNSPPTNVRALMLLNLQGNAITLSKKLWQKGAHDGSSLKRVLQAEAPRKPVFAVVAWYSTHHHLLRTWLEQSGIDPDKQVRIVVLPPPLVGEHLRGGQIDGFCVGEPWNSAAVMQGDGWIAATSRDLAPQHPEKALLVSSRLMEERSAQLQAVKAAVLEACIFCEQPENRPELAELLHRRLFPSLSREIIANALTGPCDMGAGRLSDPSAFHIFHSKDANRPSTRQAMWLLEKLEACRALTLTPAQRKQAVAAFINDPTPIPTP